MYDKNDLSTFKRDKRSQHIARRYSYVRIWIQKLWSSQFESKRKTRTVHGRLFSLQLHRLDLQRRVSFLQPLCNMWSGANFVSFGKGIGYKVFLITSFFQPKFSGLRPLGSLLTSRRFVDPLVKHFHEMPYWSVEEFFI